jgi:HlyD family secretion protein
MKKLLVFIMVVALLAGGGLGAYRLLKPANSGFGEFKTVPVARGELTATIGATGTIEPEEVIDVGAQVAGQILAFGKDAAGKPIDYGSTVDENMVLAQIDDSVYVADVAQATAAVEQAKAQVIQSQAAIVRAQADLKQMQAKADQARRDWDRAQKLGPSDALSQVSYDAYRANHEVCLANLGVGEAAIRQAEAALSQAEAQQRSAEAGLQRSSRNLGYCVIKSPVRGTIIDRRVNIGQTVVASLNAPSLFLIAKDLKRMQLWVAVNEADIGQIHAGQKVTFTADALPGERFDGAVSKIRYNATMTQNVVTYTVEVTTDNSAGKLLPYLTANAAFETGHKEGVLLVPNAALRYSPPQAAIAPVPVQDTPKSSSTTRPARKSGNVNFGTLWVKNEEGLLRAVKVRTGITDGSNTEVEGKEIAEGLQVVISEERQGGSNAGTSNPFTPSFRGGKK